MVLMPDENPQVVPNVVPRSPLPSFPPQLFPSQGSLEKDARNYASGCVKNRDTLALTDTALSQATFEPLG